MGKEVFDTNFLGLWSVSLIYSSVKNVIDIPLRNFCLTIGWRFCLLNISSCSHRFCFGYQQHAEVGICWLTESFPWTHYAVWGDTGQSSWRQWVRVILLASHCHSRCGPLCFQVDLILICSPTELSVLNVIQVELCVHFSFNMIINTSQPFHPRSA